jgi:hypothetical protein
MMNSSARYTPTGVEVKSARRNGGVAVYRTRKYFGVGSPEDHAGREPYRSWFQAIGHIARLMDQADRLLAVHPGTTSDWMPFAEALEFGRQSRPEAA